jgi:phosphopantetheinyl transferase
MQGLTRAAWLDAFYRRWTVKEAWLKAQGLGLSGDPRRLKVPLRPGRLAVPAGVARPIEIGVEARAALVVLQAAP